MVDAIGSVDSSATAGVSRLGLGQEDFLQVLLAQLTYQDPMKPLDNNEFIAQFAQITSLQQTQQTNDRLDNLLAFQSINQAVSLVGRTVEVAGEDGARYVGEATTVKFDASGNPRVVVFIDADTSLEVGLNQVVVIRDKG